MKKIISLLVVLAMLMSMAPAVFATETTEYREVTIPEAIELAELNDGNKYLVRGTVTEVANATYGNLYIEDAEGNSLYVYGVYGVDGVDRYDAMETKPVEGDEVVLLGILTTYNSTPQMKNAWLQELNGEAFEAPETEPDPEADTELTIAEAIALGKSKAHNTYTEGKYYVTGEVTEIYNTTYGNMYIQDAEGNVLTVYGTYDADGTNRFDAMENQPAVGDTITVYGVIGQYNGTPQMKNGWIQEDAGEEPETPAVEPTLFLGNNELAAADYASSEYVYVAEQTGTLYITLRSYTCNGIEYGAEMLDYGWSELFINGERLKVTEKTLEVVQGDVITVQITSDMDEYVAWLDLSYEGFYEEPVGSKLNPIYLTPEQCPTTAEIPAGEELYYSLDYGFSEHVLYIYGENAYIVYEGWNENGEWGDIYVYAVDGVVTFEVWQYEIRIGNAGDTDATFEVDAVLPVGLETNPAQLVIGENVTEMSASMWGYHYIWTAEEAGTLTITVSGGPYWAFRLQNVETAQEFYYWEIDNQPNTASVDVNAGDVVLLMLRLHEPVEWESIDGTLTVLAEFAPEGGSEGGEEGGEESVYTWTAETDGLFAVSMLSTNWSYTINGVTHTSSDEKPVYMTIIEVAAGDVITLNVGTADGTAGTVDFTTATYAVGDPIDIQFIYNEAYTSGAINVDMPAGEFVFQMMSGAGMILTVDGVVTEMTGDGWFDPITFNVTNAEAGIVEMTLTYPEGSYYNPAQLELGYNSAEIEEYSEMGYWYTYTAEADGLFVLNMLSDNWFYSAMIQRADGGYGYPDGHMSGETDADGNPFPVSMQILDLKAGDVVLLNFGTSDYAAATVEFNTMFYSVGDPIEIMFVFDEAYTTGAINVDMPAGDFTFMMYNGAGMTLTVDGVETEMTGDGWFDPITFNVTNAEAGVVAMTLTYPVGSYYNPAQLELGYNSCDIEEYSQMGYWYTYTAESDCLFALSMYSDNWFYSAMIQRADGSASYPDGHYSNETDANGNPINVTMQVLDLKAGDVVLLNFGTADYTAATVEFSTTVYAGTEEDPVLIDFIWNDEGNGASVMADLPAGEYVYGQYRLSGMTLTINGEEVEYVDGGWYGPCIFTINNESGNNALYTMELTYAEGHMMNPHMAELGDNLADIKANNYEGYFFNWIAPEAGTLTVTVTSDGGWFFTVQNETQGIYGDDHWCDDDPVVNTETIQVKAGDLIVIVVGTFDPVTYERPAGQVNVNLQFEAMTAEMGDVNGDGAIDTTDAKLIMQYDLGLIDETGLELAAADVNGDGAVDTTDAKLIMQYDLGLIEEF